VRGADYRFSFPLDWLWVYSLLVGLNLEISRKGAVIHAGHWILVLYISQQTLNLSIIRQPSTHWSSLLRLTVKPTFPVFSTHNYLCLFSHHEVPRFRCHTRCRRLCSPCCRHRSSRSRITCHHWSNQGLQLRWYVSILETLIKTPLTPLPGTAFTQAYITNAITHAAQLKYNQDPLKEMTKCDLSSTHARDCNYPFPHPHPPYFFSITN
jgi:hypothetical protein